MTGTSRRKCVRVTTASWCTGKTGSPRCRVDRVDLEMRLAFLGHRNIQYKVTYQQLTSVLHLTEIARIYADSHVHLQRVGAIHEKPVKCQSGRELSEWQMAGLSNP